MVSIDEVIGGARDQLPRAARSTKRVGLRRLLVGLGLVTTLAACSSSESPSGASGSPAPSTGGTVTGTVPALFDRIPDTNLLLQTADGRGPRDFAPIRIAGKPLWVDGACAGGESVIIRLEPGPPFEVICGAQPSRNLDESAQAGLVRISVTAQDGQRWALRVQQ